MRLQVKAASARKRARKEGLLHRWIFLRGWTNCWCSVSPSSHIGHIVDMSTSLHALFTGMPASSSSKFMAPGSTLGNGIQREPAKRMSPQRPVTAPDKSISPGSRTTWDLKQTSNYYESWIAIPAANKFAKIDFNFSKVFFFLTIFSQSWQIQNTFRPQNC